MKKSHPLIIIGSARSDGNTHAAVDGLVGENSADRICLADKRVNFYDYDISKQDDDFVGIVEEMAQYNKIVLATPVYWYSMSGQLKAFIDRWADLLGHYPELLDKLRGTTFYLVASYGGNLPQDFAETIRLTCEYMKFGYGGELYYYSGTDADRQAANIPEIERLRKAIWEK